MTVVDGVGRVLRAGGRVVKNVAGYDLPRVLVGSLGTLAVIADVTLRTQPRPDVVGRCTLDFTDERPLEAIRQRLFRSRLPLRSFDIVGEHDRQLLSWRMHLSMEGTAKQVDYLHTSIKTLAREEACHIDVPGAGTHSDDGANFVARFATTASTVVGLASTLLARASAIVDRARVLLECGGALLRLRATCTSHAEFAALIQMCKKQNEAGAGELLLEDIPSEQKREFRRMVRADTRPPPDARRARRWLQPFFGQNGRERIVRSDQIDDRLLRGRVRIGIDIATAFRMDLAGRQKALARDLTERAGKVQGKFKTIGHGSATH